MDFDSIRQLSIEIRKQGLDFADLALHARLYNYFRKSGAADALAATLRLIDDIKKYNKINGLKEELSALYLQKYTLDQACSCQSQSLIVLAKLKSYGLTEDRLLQLNNFLEDNAFKISSYTGTK